MDIIDEINNRIIQVYNTHNLSQAEFSKLCGISQSTLSLFLKGKYKSLNIKSLANIIIKLNIDANWLFLGIGVPHRNNQVIPGSPSKKQFTEEKVERLINSLATISKNYSQLSIAYNQLLESNTNNSPQNHPANKKNNF